MPGKSEIMRAVREGLDNLEVVKPWTDTKGSKAVKTKLCEIGREFKFKVGAKRNEVEKAYRDFGEWLYDVTWLEYEPKPFPDGLLIDVHLVAECEWGNFEHIVEDFEKLLQARTGFRLDDLHRLQPGQIRGDRGAACREGLGVQRLPC